MKISHCGGAVRLSGRVLVLSLVLTAGVRSAQAQCRPDIYGMGHFLAAWAGQPLSYDAQAMDKMVEMGATAVWIDFPWSSMEETQGSIDWSYADHQVNTAEAHGLKMYAYVGTTPTWARAYPALPGHRTPPAEAYLSHFQSFFSAVAARYAGRVDCFQFWNEPSGCSWINEGCSNGNCELFTLWQKRAYDALNTGNPNCIVSTGGFDGNPAPYVQCMYNELDGEEAFDAVSIHPYASGGPGGPGTGGEAIDYSDLTTVRGVMIDHGDSHKPIWITEYGWNTTNETQRSQDLTEVLTELKKSEYHHVTYAKHLVLNDWTTFCCYGLTDPFFAPKPAFNTFKNFDKSFDDVVDFDADVKIGDVPLTVLFTDASCVAGASGCSWEFGDGGTSNDCNPTHKYTEPGEYDIRLTVTGDNGQIVEEKSGYIRAGTFIEILNPSYEDPLGYFNQWSHCIEGDATLTHNPTTHIPTPRYHDGANSAGISFGGNGNQVQNGAIFQEVDAMPGRTYLVRTWAFASAGLNNVPQFEDDSIELRVRDGDASAIQCADSGNVIKSNTTLLEHVGGSQPIWRLLEGAIHATQNHLTVVAFWEFAGANWVANSVHVDDWELIDITVGADLNHDGHVDADDHDLFVDCATGPSISPPTPGCDSADFDGDNDIDVRDHALLQRCYTGPETYNDPTCEL